jgi:hypothetical protein
MLFVDRDPVASHMAEWPRGGPPRAFEVVDGQQRLTTLTILFSALSDLDHYEPQHSDDVLLRSIRAGDGLFRLRLRDPDAAWPLMFKMMEHHMQCRRTMDYLWASEISWRCASNSSRS